MASEKKGKPWLKDLLVAFAGTTLSIVLTFGTSALIDRSNRNKDRRLTAMMVLSSIESSIRSLEENVKILARKDTVATWLLCVPVSEIPKMKEEVLVASIQELLQVYSVGMDKTIESIFSSNTDTWKNMGNFQFIDNVGKTYATLHEMETELKEQTLQEREPLVQIVTHPEKYPGKSLPEKVLQDGNARMYMAAVRQTREWLNYVIAMLRESNRQSMALVGITEEEVIAFTDERALGEDATDAINAAFLQGDFRIRPLLRDSLSTMPAVF